MDKKTNTTILGSFFRKITHRFLVLILDLKQSSVLKEIASALTSDYRYILLEAPTGFWKSPFAIATALTLGSSYILTSTKNLQTQYASDFPFVRIAKGKNNFRCEVKDDFIKKIIPSGVSRVVVYNQAAIIHRLTMGHV